MAYLLLSVSKPPTTSLSVSISSPSTSFTASCSNASNLPPPANSFLGAWTGKSMRGQRKSWIVRMAPEEEKMTRRSPLDFPIEWERPKPGRRPDILPQFSPMKTPLPPPMPTDPPPEEDEEEEEEEKKEEEEEDPNKEDPDKKD